MSNATAVKEGNAQICEMLGDGYLGAVLKDLRTANETISDFVQIPASGRFLICFVPIELEKWLHPWRCGRCCWTGFYPVYSADGDAEFCPKCGLREVGKRYDFLWTGEDLPEGEAERRCLAGKHTPIDAVIVPSSAAWAESIKGQCEASGVLFVTISAGEKC